MNYFKISLGIFVVLAASRFIPHPPNFTALLALTFYIPIFFGIKYIPIIVICFALTDLFLGFHPYTLFTWGSILLIGYISKYFLKTIQTRIFGTIVGACIFYLITNFGVWLVGNYTKNLEGLLLCYTLAIPFFSYTIVSTLLYSFIIEIVYLLYYLRKIKIK